MNKIKKSILLILVLLCIFSLTACEKPKDKEPEKVEETKTETTKVETKKEDIKEEKEEDKKEEETVEEKVEIENFDRILVFEKNPEKILTTSVSMGEVLTALGEAGNLDGVLKSGVAIENILPEYRDDFDKVPDLFETMGIEREAGAMLPSLEAFIGAEPDLVIVDSFVFNVESFGKPEDYEDAGINLYVTESTNVKEPTLEESIKDIENIGKIVGKSEEAKNIVNDMRSRVAAVEDKIKDKEPVNVVLYDRIMEGKLFIGAGASLETSLLKSANCNNLFGDIKEKYATISFEELLDKDPDVLIVYKYSPEQYENTLKELNENPEFSKLTAVKEGRIIPLNFLSTRAGLQNVNLIEDVAKDLYPDLFN